MNLLDSFLNKITMYKLTLYSLYFLSATALVLSFLGKVPFDFIHLLFLLSLLIVCGALASMFFSWLFSMPANPESSIITALILFLIVAPPENGTEIAVICGCAILAIASKYFFSIRRKHIFNPAAIALVIISFFGSGLAIWWVATAWMLPFVGVVGLLIIRKLRRFDLFSSFILTSLISIFYFHTSSAPLSLWQVFISWPIIFFSTIMLTEPQTAAQSKVLRICYGAIIGLLFGLQFHIGSLYSSPQLALIIGNIFAYITGPKYKIKATFKAKRQLSIDTYEYVFEMDQKVNFKAGQYLEWTLAHKKPDNRGIRRYFTISSSPRRAEISIGVRMAQKPSSFKRQLQALLPGDTLFAGQLGGSFVLSEKSIDKSRDGKSHHKKIAWLAGGIGITPFVSMARYLFETGQKRDIVLVYAAQNNEQFAYGELFDRYSSATGIHPIYHPTDQLGRINKQTILEHIADYKQRLFYISGPDAMVTNYKKLLISMGLPRNHIKTDYFPGF